MLYATIIRIAARPREDVFHQRRGKQNDRNSVNA